jgi:hypothetical protein
MRKLHILLPAVVGLLALTSYAGQPMVSSGKETKEVKQTVPEETCFNDHELELGIFGQYSVGEGPTHAGPMRDHGWGGGVEVNYFFLRYVGIGVEGSWEDMKENAHFASHDTHSSSTALHEVGGSLILRYPIDHLCLAPYIFGGGSFQVDGRQWAAGHAGVGLEYRIVPHKVAIFADGRWNFFGSRDDLGQLNNFTARAGFRVIF